MTLASGSDGRPRHGKRKGLTNSFISIMSKISRSRNKRSNKARDIPAPTQRKRVKASDWEQTGPADGGSIDLELIPSYGGHVAGSWLIKVPITNLSTASRIDAKELAGYWSLLVSYMPDRIVRQFGFKQCIPSHPIRSQEARRPTNNRMSVVKNLFAEALWLEAPLHLFTETWTSVPTIPPSACTDDYMQWFLPRSHPRIQNPLNIPHGFHVPADPPMPPQTLKEEKFDRMLDLLTRHYLAS
ncbi:hypothetical protein M9H77_31653 [Catharanthus roseus]|uniref:Uncharacterized protein n=1 Tax=Catharanthus roseus TaxID=4058 RepID=A0ACC0A4L1_CATRO|nr:hypothetical protein M9H77_31653 [Catharanthus roseus]